jgi:hypothetical protein
LLAGMAIGLASVSIQIGALSGVSTSTAGLAAGLVETMREIGGAVGVAAVSTVLIGGAVSGAATIGAGDDLVDTFQAAFAVIAVFAVLGGLLAAVGLARTSPRVTDESIEVDAAIERTVDGAQRVA